MTREELVELIVEAVIHDRRFQRKLASIHHAAGTKTKFHHAGKAYSAKRKGDTTVAYRRRLAGLVKSRVGSIGS